MIIRPNVIEKKNISKPSKSIIKGEDEFGKFVRKEKTYITDDKRHFVKSMIEYRPDSNYILKEKSSGLISPVYGNTDSIHCEELTRGHVCLSNDCDATSKDYDLNIPSPGISPSAKSFYCIGEYGVPGGPSKFYIDNNVNKIKYDRSMSDIELFSDMVNVVYSSENLYQMAFYEFVGLINSFFSLWLWMYPMDAFVIIDCNRCIFDVKNFTIFDKLDETTRNKFYISFMNSVSDLTKLLNHVCVKERKNMLVHVFLGSDCVIQLIDRDRKQSETVLLTSLDVGNQLMLSSISGTTGFCTSESLGLLTNMKTGSSITNLLLKDVLSSTYLDMCEWTKEYSQFGTYGGL